MNSVVKLKITLSIFIFVLVFLFSNLPAQNSKTKIYQTATVDLGQILELIETDDNFRLVLENYRDEQFSKAEEIRLRVEELEAYLEDNPDFSVEKKKEIINDITYQKNLLEKMIGGENGDSDEGFLDILYQVIEKIAEREGFSLVVEKRSAVLYYTEDVDLTDRVIREIKNQLN